MRRGFCALGVVLACAGCSSHRSVLYAGVHFGVSGGKHVVSDAEARKAEGTVRAEWERALEQRARDPGTFHNLSQDELGRRIDATSKKYGFDVVSVTFLRPRLLAPMVVVRTTHYIRLARALHAILDQLDPKVNTGNDVTGWAYEAFYFEAQDERAVPLVITSNALRGPSSEGSQWARSDALYPFGHL